MTKEKIMTTENAYKLSDSVIAHVAKALQVAIITGTDIVDNLRLMDLIVVNGELVLTPDCEENFETNLNSMLQSVPSTDSLFSS